MVGCDYGKPTAMNHVRLKWETAHGKDYRIQTSNDNEVWSTVATVTDGDGGDDVVWFPRTTARLVRLYGDHRGGVEENLWGFSLFDMEVGDWGPTDLRAEVLDQNTVRWTWTDNADDETGYRFYGAETPQGPFNLLVELPPNTASYIESGLRPVVNYHRRLLAVGPEGESSPVEAASGLLSSPGNSLGSVKAYPNPFHPGRDPLFFVAQIPVGSTVRLFTVSGEQVRELPPADQAGISRWDGRNEHGNPVASGVYLVVIKENEQTKTIRVGVE